MLLPLLCVIHDRSTKLITGYVGSWSCHGGRCYDHPVAYSICWCCNSGRCYDHPGCVYYLADVTANCACCNYHMSACILALLLTHEAECYHIYIVYVWLLWTGFINCEIAHEKIQCKICRSFFYQLGNMTTGFYNVSQ